MPYADTPYDTDQQTLTEDLYSVEGLRKWLMEQDPETEYSFTTSGICLLTQYFEVHGIGLTLGRSSLVYDGKSLDFHPLSWVAVERPWTFGAALERCNEVLKHGWVDPRGRI